MLIRICCIAFWFGLPITGKSAELDWLSGHWRSEEGSKVSEEIWTASEGGLMLAVNRSIRDGKARAFEYLRIMQSDDETVYCAQPGGSPAVCFKAVKTESNHVVFENSEHDFPQRIEYVRDGEMLKATISDLDRTQSFSSQWHRIRD